MAWTEVGLIESDYPVFAKTIKETHPEWDQVSKILILDVCASFAADSGFFTLIFISPLLASIIHPAFVVLFLLSFFLITPMPDWGYDEGYLKERMQKWESKPRWLHFINPIRIIGYPIALLFISKMYRHLKNEFA